MYGPGKLLDLEPRVAGLGGTTSREARHSLSWKSTREVHYLVRVPCRDRLHTCIGVLPAREGTLLVILPHMPRRSSHGGTPENLFPLQMSVIGQGASQCSRIIARKLRYHEKLDAYQFCITGLQLSW